MPAERRVVTIQVLLAVVAAVAAAVLLLWLQKNGFKVPEAFMWLADQEEQVILVMGPQAEQDG